MDCLTQIQQHTPPLVIETVEPVAVSEPRLFERRAGNATAFLASLVVHVAAMLLLACLVYRSGRASHGIQLTAVEGTSETVAFEMSEKQPIAPTEFEARTPDRMEADVSLDVSLDNIFAEQSQAARLSASLTSISVGSIAESLSEGGRERGASFFGTYAEGNRFIYILDSSRSMSGDRWTYACNQLIDSLRDLKPGQEFFVLCFDVDTSYLFDVSPKAATYLEPNEELIKRVREWLRYRRLGRATMPANALRAGIKFDPDAIFLLSDGELQDNSLRILRIINKPSYTERQIPIHTIHLFSREGRDSLETMAKQNSGSFTHIDGS
ncbi:MAG: vWA domain-containing protein [Pirellulaceae bacterium]